METTIKVLILHNAYRWEGGEDRAVANEAAMLQAAGHEVSVEIVRRPDPATYLDNANLLLKAPYDPQRKISMLGLLDRVRPEIVHVHNFFPQLTYAVHEAAHEQGAGVVQTLHNYRLLCAASTFERKGKVCELCLGGRRLAALRHRCFHGSLGGTAALVRMQRLNDRRGLLTANVDRFIALTDFARQKFIEGGFPAEKLVVKPNFHDRPDPPPSDEQRSGALFVGRLSHEKGIDVLLEAWARIPDTPLTVLGDGPMREQLQAKAPWNVRFMGQVSPATVEAEIRRAGALIIPSLWYEGLPMVLVEACANGLPAIASNIGSLAEVLEHGKTAVLCNPNSAASLAAGVRKFFADPAGMQAMSAAVRRLYEERYTPERNLACSKTSIGRPWCR